MEVLHRYVLICVVWMGRIMSVASTGEEVLPPNEVYWHWEYDPNRLTDLHMSFATMYVNYWRSYVALGDLFPLKPAEQMLEVIWDPRLKRLAQTHTDKFLTERLAFIPEDRFERVGQLIYYTTLEKQKLFEVNDYMTIFSTWFKEFRKFHGKATSENMNFVELVNDRVEKIGCGRKQYKNSTAIYDVFICYFGPGANLSQNYPYLQGEPACEKHGHYESFIIPGLCKKVDKYAEQEAYFPEAPYKEPPKEETGHPVQIARSDKLNFDDERGSGGVKNQNNFASYIGLTPPPLSSSCLIAPALVSVFLPLLLFLFP